MPFLFLLDYKTVKSKIFSNEEVEYEDVRQTSKATLVRGRGSPYGCETARFAHIKIFGLYMVLWMT
jgi:hypothetical protein